MGMNIENTLSPNPKLRYMQLWLLGRINEAIELKYSIIPKILYHFDKPKEERFVTLESRQIHLSQINRFDDPFDSIGFFADLPRLCKKYGRTEKEFKEFLVTLQKSMRTFSAACFTENLFLPPLWASYADYYSGFAIEYNFYDLGIDHDINKWLFPVIYESQRIPMTSAIDNLFSNFEEILIGNLEKTHPYDFMFFFMNFIKHKSWEFQKEWRIVGENSIQNITPKAIYLGFQCTKSTQDRILGISKMIGCDVHKMDCINSMDEEFNFSFYQIA